MLGALGFGFRSSIDPELLDVAGTLADVTALALERARLYEREHAAAHQLQKALLPPVTLTFPGVQAAVRYRAAEEHHDVGGDWYDVFELPNGRIGFAVGDVVGHDLSSAAAMGRLQAVLRVVAAAGPGPARVLEELDQASRRSRAPSSRLSGTASTRPPQGPSGTPAPVTRRRSSSRRSRPPT